MEILSNLVSGNANMESIKGKLFDVVKVPLITGLDGFENPDTFGIYRATGGQPLGSVGKDYTPTQPKLLFDEFESCLYQTDADFNDVTYLEFVPDRTCNLGCSYCAPTISTTWAKDIRRNGPYENLPTDHRNHYKTTGDEFIGYTYGDANPYADAFFK